MVSFESDYTTGAHPEVLKRLIETNDIPVSGYGSDPFTEGAKEKIKKAIEMDDADVFFLVGGTQTNEIVISTLLRDYEGVVACETGHVGVHEAGAIEFMGHKVLTVPSHEGKICPKELKAYIENFYLDGNHEHMVFPGMVYISYPTELGSIYSKEELSAIHEICKSYEIPLFIDGARLAYGLMSKSCDITLPELARLCDVFYIGGTKVGALIGEAVVFTNKNMPLHFVNSVKKRGALLAKGRVLGVQYDALFTDNLYLNIGKHVIDCAEKLKSILKNAGLPFFYESATNQQFVIIENEKMPLLRERVQFSFWETVDETHTAIRFVTSWSTKEEDLDALKEALKLI